MGLSPHMFDELVNNCLYFALGVIVVLIGSFFLFTGTYPRNAQPRKPSRQALGGGILLLGLAIAAPFAPTVFDVIMVMVTPDEVAQPRLLAHDETVGGIAFHAGTIVSTMSGGLLISAELKQPHNIQGLNVIGHVDFWRISPGNHLVSRATLVADQEIPNSSGAWCSPAAPVNMSLEYRYLKDCTLARPLTRDTAMLPAGAHFEYGESLWSVSLDNGSPPASIAGISVPGGWKMCVAFDPIASLCSLWPLSDPAPDTQLWVEIGGIRLTGTITFQGQPNPVVSGELWEDATIEGAPHKKGDGVHFQL